MFNLMHKLINDDAAIKGIFDYLRNAGLCSVLGTIGVWNAHHASGTGFNHYFQLTIAYMFGFLAVFLYILNYAHGLRKIQDAPTKYGNATLLFSLFHSVLAVFAISYFIEITIFKVAAS